MQYVTSPERVSWQFPDGQRVDLGIGDEIEIDTSMPLIPTHRGIVYAVGDGTPSQVKVIHNNKGPGVEVLGWNEFSQGQQVRLRRRPSSPEHASAIWQRAHANIGHQYHPLNNCEHFTDFCYKGQQGESPTLQKWVLGVVGVAVLIVAGNSD
jgi:hypothetical protein